MKTLDLVHKNKKFRFYSKNISQLMIPRIFFKKKLPELLASLKEHDLSYINGRVEYYNKLTTKFTVNHGVSIKDYKNTGSSAYYFDLLSILRYFSDELKVSYLFGDIKHVPEVPTFVKSRFIEADNAKAILLKLNTVRHYNFVRDRTKFQDKLDRAVWRGRVSNQKQRSDLLKLYHNHAKCDVGDTDKRQVGTEYYKSHMSLSEQLEYKFNISIEGNDVATNTKWIMSSNSLCFMPKPKFETWFMEGRLTSNYHYVLLKDDYTDLEEKIDYYSEHPAEALEIIQNAQAYVEQFKHEERERLISVLVLKKYFELSGQL